MELVKNNKLVTAIILAVIAGLTAFLASWEQEESPKTEETAVEVAPAAEAPAAEAPAADVVPAAETAPAAEAAAVPAAEIVPAITETKVK
jgi:hypothetical protein